MLAQILKKKKLFTYVNLINYIYQRTNFRKQGFHLRERITFAQNCLYVPVDGNFFRNILYILNIIILVF